MFGKNRGTHSAQMVHVERSRLSAKMVPSFHGCSWHLWQDTSPLSGCPGTTGCLWEPRPQAPNESSPTPTPTSKHQLPSLKQTAAARREFMGTCAHSRWESFAANASPATPPHSDRNLLAASSSLNTKGVHTHTMSEDYPIPS